MRTMLLAAAGLVALSATPAAFAQDVVVMRRVVAPPVFTYQWRTADGACVANGRRTVTATCTRAQGGAQVGDGMCTSAKPTTRADASCSIGGIVNGDFENDLSGWSASGAVIEVRNGSKTVVVYSPDNYTGVSLSQTVDATPGARLTLSYSTALIPGKFTGEMQPIARDTAGNVIAFNTIQITSTTPKTVSLPFTVPAGVTKVKIDLIGWAAGARNAGAPTGFWMDDIQVK